MVQIPLISGVLCFHLFVKKWKWSILNNIYRDKMKILNCLLLILFIFTGCESNMQYPWITETPFQGILNLANGKLILIDFETEW